MVLLDGEQSDGWRISTLGVSVVTHEPRTPAFYRQRLASFTDLAHVTVEVNHCHEEESRAA